VMKTELSAPELNNAGLRLYRKATLHRRFIYGEESSKESS
jgi:hypothetical protein